MHYYIWHCQRLLPFIRNIQMMNLSAYYILLCVHLLYYNLNLIILQCTTLRHPPLLMQHLILARHGDYDPTRGNITQKGLRDVANLGRNLLPFISGNGLIRTSTIVRARQTAKALEQILRLPVEQLPALGVPQVTTHDLRAILQEVIPLGQNIDSLVLVTHGEVCSLFSLHYGQVILSTRFQKESLETSEAFVIDCEARSRIKISSSK